MYTLNDFRPGNRVEMHPATDLWAMGARYGQIIRIGRQRLVVKLDKLNHTVRVSPENICDIIE